MSDKTPVVKPIKMIGQNTRTLYHLPKKHRESLTAHAWDVLRYIDGKPIYYPAGISIRIICLTGPICIGYGKEIDDEHYPHPADDSRTLIDRETGEPTVHPGYWPVDEGSCVNLGIHDQLILDGANRPIVFRGRGYSSRIIHGRADEFNLIAISTNEEEQEEARRQ